MDQLTLSCPACDQPVGKEDLYCEACGTRLHAPATGHPTTANGSAATPRAGAAGHGGPGQAAGAFGATAATALPGQVGQSGQAGQGRPRRLGSPPTTTPDRRAAHPEGAGTASPGNEGLRAEGEARTGPGGAGEPGDTGAGLQGPVLPPDPRAVAGGAAGAAGPAHGSESAAGAAAGTSDATGATGTTGTTGTTGDFVLAAPLPPGMLLAEDGESDVAEDITGLGTPGAGQPAQDESELETASAGNRPPAAGPQQTCSHCGAKTIDADGYCESCGRPLPRPRDHQERALESIAGVTDRGFRHHRNEDAFSVAATRRPDGSPVVVAVVCDGVSSASHPDVASELASETGTEHLLGALESGTAPEEAMTAAILHAADAVDALADRTPREPGHNSPACTCVSAVAADGRVTIGWVGDSRAYWFPDDRSIPAERLTVDDSWATRMVEAGLLEEAEAYADPRAHAITGWLGADAIEVEPHVESFVPDVPGVVLVCTDGLWNYAEGAGELAAVVPADARTRPLEAARSLVGFALENGGHDNITVAILPWDPAELAPDGAGHAGTGTLTDLDADPDPDHAPTEYSLPVLDPPPGGPAAPTPTSTPTSTPTTSPARPSDPSPRSPEER
ncbi:PP2C family protein-serine/threonine phosphatase [Phaeacidiphilus oryzae]|uniref:PP2C family protein-serine/threonine phosphatase n=1 Tax=Phaeacidiphilus oryzae TaxID=348818 RepID=UPI00068F0E20|nr:PP2C family serine/threonine-protein phosphatase [Phaeacidiphilus oryzae]